MTAVWLWFAADKVDPDVWLWVAGVLAVLSFLIMLNGRPPR